MGKQKSDAGFDRWWNDEGSGIAPKPDEEHCFHAERVARIAWANGAFVASTWPDPVAALEAQLAEYRDRAWRAESQLTIRVALRKGLEAALGFADGETYDEAKFAEAVKRVSALQAERDELRIQVTDLIVALTALLDEYDDRAAQFGNDFLWQKHEDKERIGRVRAALPKPPTPAPAAEDRRCAERRVSAAKAGDGTTVWKSNKFGADDSFGWYPDRRVSQDRRQAPAAEGGAE